MFFKFFKYDTIDIIGDVFLNPYFATPGECTRSKTTGSYKINPFDLSNHEPKTMTHLKNLSCSPLYNTVSK